MPDDATTNECPTPDAPNRRKRFRWVWWLLLALVLLVAAAAFAPALFMRVGFMPLVFNESFYGHRHCMKQLGMALKVYASDNKEVFPAHPGGYGDALLLLHPTYSGHAAILTGPCYQWGVFDDALRFKTHLPESACGRVYVQGLRADSNYEIAVAWDKQPTAGGDHHHFYGKLFAVLLREVCMLDGTMRRIPEKDWPDFSKKQIELLVEAGIPRERAVALYAEKPKFTP